MTRLPASILADIDQDSAEIRDLIDKRPTIADELSGDTELGILLKDWGKLIAAHIFGAGQENEMNLRALAWIEFLGGFET